MDGRLAFGCQVICQESNQNTEVTHRSRVAAQQWCFWGCRGWWAEWTEPGSQEAGGSSSHWRATLSSRSSTVALWETPAQCFHSAPVISIQVNHMERYLTIQFSPFSWKVSIFGTSSIGSTWAFWSNWSISDKWKKQKRSANKNHRGTKWRSQVPAGVYSPVLGLVYPCDCPCLLSLLWPVSHLVTCVAAWISPGTGVGVSVHWFPGSYSRCGNATASQSCSHTDICVTVTVSWPSGVSYLANALFSFLSCSLFCFCQCFFTRTSQIPLIRETS